MLEVVIQYFFDDRSHSKYDWYSKYGKNDVTVCVLRGYMLSLLVIRQDTHVFESKVKQMEKLWQKSLNASENKFYMILLYDDELKCNVQWNSELEYMLLSVT